MKIPQLDGSLVLEYSEVYRWSEVSLFISNIFDKEISLLILITGINETKECRSKANS